jgi:hypothetical protein
VVVWKWILKGGGGGIVWAGFIGSECEQLADPVSLINLGNLTSWECISFSWKALFHGISYSFTWSACCTWFYCIHSDLLPIIKTWMCCIRPVPKEMSGFLWLRTCIIEGISVSLRKYSSGILDCGQRSQIENLGFLPGTHCSNLASILCLTYWPKYIPSTCIILSRFINTLGYGSLIEVLCLLDV